MTSFRTRIDFYFAGFGRMVFRHRFKTLLVMALVIAAFLSQLPKLTVDTSNESYFHKDDPTIGDYDAFREQFGRESYVIIPIEPPEIFDTAFLRKLKAFHEKLQEEVPYLEDITSLVNVRNTRGDGDVLVVEDLLKVIPETPEKMARFKGLALSSKLYRNFLISEDGKVTNVIIETFAYSPGKGEEDLAAGFQEDEGKQEEAGEVRTPLTQEENRELVQAVNRIAAEFNGPDFPLIVAGGPPTDEFFDRMMQKDMGQFLMLAVLSIAILLFLLFRRFSGVLLPLLVVILSLLSTIGVMAAAGVPFTIPTLILPSFLLAMGIGAGVHLMAVFYRYYQAGGDKEQALVDTLEHSGFPILMTSLTTAAGLFAFSNAEMAPVAHLGIFAGIGVLLAFVYTLVLTPALLAILPIHRTAWIGKGRGTGGFDRLLVGIADFATSRALGIVLVSAVVMVLAIGGLFSLRFSMNFLDWFPKDLELRKGIELVDERFKGSMNLEVVVDTGKENGLYEPKVLNQMEALARYAEQQTKPDGSHYVGKTNSVVDVLKEINKALNENREEFYTVPQNRKLIAQELLLFENSGSDDLEDVVDSQLGKARLSLIVPWDDTEVYVEFVGDLRREAEALLGDNATVTITGELNLFTQMIFTMMQSMAQSYLIAAVVITIMMMLLVGSIRIGVLSMIANLAPIVLTMGLIMGYFDIRLDVFTLLIGSIALGLAVDDTIHFFHNFRRYYGEGKSVQEAVRETLLTTGRAMMFTTLVLVIGFWLFMFATLNNVFNFGLLTGIALLFALAADFLLAPAMLTLVIRSSYGRTLTERWCNLEPAVEGD